MKQYKNAGAFMLDVDRLVAVSEDGLAPFPTRGCAGRWRSGSPCARRGRTRCCCAFAVDPERDIPYVLGHECAGTVVEVGENVKNLAVGDRVCCEPGVPCGHCEQCRSGHYNLCPDVVFWATPPVQGCYMRYVPFRADFCFRLPENVSTRAGALAEPFAIAAGAPVEQVVTHEYALEDIQQAFDDSVHRKNEVVKAIIRI